MDMGRAQNRDGNPQSAGEVSFTFKLFTGSSSQILEAHGIPSLSDFAKEIKGASGKNPEDQKFIGEMVADVIKKIESLDLNSLGMSDRFALRGYQQNLTKAGFSEAASKIEAVMKQGLDEELATARRYEEAYEEQKHQRPEFIGYSSQDILVISEAQIPEWAHHAVDNALKVFEAYFPKKKTRVDQISGSIESQIKDLSKANDDTSQIDATAFLTNIYDKMNDQAAENIVLCIIDEKLSDEGTMLRGASLHNLAQVSLAAIESLVQNIKENFQEFAANFRDDNSLRTVLLTRLITHELGHVFGLPKIEFGEVHDQRSGWHCNDNKTCCMRTAFEDDDWIKQIMQELNEEACFCQSCTNHLTQIGKERVNL